MRKTPRCWNATKPANGAAAEPRCPLKVYFHKGRRPGPLVRARSAPDKRTEGRSPVRPAWNVDLTLAFSGAGAQRLHPLEGHCYVLNELRRINTTPSTVIFNFPFNVSSRHYSPLDLRLFISISVEGKRVKYHIDKYCHLVCPPGGTEAISAI